MFTITKYIKVLSDGSLVFDVSIENGAMVWFDFPDEDACDHFIRTMAFAIDQYTLNTVSHETVEETEI